MRTGLSFSRLAFSIPSFCTCAIVGVFAVAGCGSKETKTEGAGRTIAFPGAGQNSESSGGGIASVGAKPTEVSGTLSLENVKTLKGSFDNLYKQFNPFELSASGFSSGAFSSPVVVPGQSGSGATATPTPAATPLALNSGLLISTVRNKNSLTSATPSENCYSVGGDSSDADGDGWAKNLTLTYNCGNQNLGGTSSSSTSANEVNLKISGSVIVTDANDALKFPEAGYAITFQNLSFTLSGISNEAGTSSAEQFQSIINGSEAVTVNGGSISTEVNLKSTFLDGGKSGELGEWITLKLTPTDKTKPAAAGDVDFSGFYSFSDASDSGNAVTVKFSSQNLKYGCTNGNYKSGTLTMEAASGKLVYTFADCNSNVKLNDTVL